VFGKRAPEAPRKIEGVFAAAITPRRPGTCEIDLAAALELIDWLGARKIQGLVLLGSTGEFVHFGPEERSRLAHLGVKRSRVPVLVNVAHSTLDEAVQLGRNAADAGAAGLLLTPPYFFRYSDSEVVAFYREFAAGLRRDVPLFLYNIPHFAPGVSLECADQLLGAGGFAGIKDSGGDWPYLQALLERKAQQPFTLLVGNDGLFLPARRAGADGVVSGISSALPELLLALEQVVKAQDTAGQEYLQNRLQEVISWLKKFPVPAGVKQMVAWRNVNAGPLATPLSPQLAQTAGEFEQWFREWLPVVLEECRHAY